MHKDYNIAFGTQSKIHIWIFMCTNKVVSQCKTIVTNAFLLSEYQNSEKKRVITLSWVSNNFVKLKSITSHYDENEKKMAVKRDGE